MEVMPCIDALSSRAIAAAVSVAAAYGLRCDAPQLLADGSNVLLHLQPLPVVARISTTTGMVRKPPERWMALDLDIAAFLAAQGFPVVPPSEELPPGPHLHDGLAITFWQYVEHERGYRAPADAVAPRLRDLHEALRGYAGDLRPMGPVAEIPVWLNEVERWQALRASDIAMLRRGYSVVAADIAALGLPAQPLHGDAHAGNLLKTKHGLLWTDFEDACSGPVAWDLACFLRTCATKGDDAMASYDNTTQIDRLAPFLAARDLQGALWTAILATRFPNRRERAEEWLAKCRALYS